MQLNIIMLGVVDGRKKLFKDCGQTEKENFVEFGVRFKKDKPGLH